MKKRTAVLVILLLGAIIVLTLASACAVRRYRGPYAEVNGDFAGIDDLGRVIPISGSAPEARDRKVGIFYFLWQGEHGTSGPYDNYKIVLNHPEAIESEENWLAAGGGNRGAHHFWGEPLFGYYVMSDEWVIRKHVQMLTDAGVDFIVFDTTNGPRYLDRVKQLIDVWYEYLEQGYDVPKLTFYTHTDSGQHIAEYYKELYTNEAMHEKYPRLDELWYCWDGKPMIIGESWILDVTMEMEDYFTIKESIWPTEAAFKPNGFPWMEFSRLYTNAAVYGRNGRKEVANVSVAQHNVTVNFASSAWYGGGDHTRSWHNGSVDRSPEAIYYGYNFADQWKWAIEADPEMIFVTGWNEWVAQRQASSPKQPVSFVDCANPEASRDCEPMNGLFGDNYYMQLISNIRLYKGTQGRVATGGNVTIDIDGGFGQWDSEKITAVYTDYEGDTADRGNAGFGGIQYIDETGRNDFVTFKVARDKNYIYFYAETAEDITPADGDNWMTLFIASGAWNDGENKKLAGNLIDDSGAGFWYGGIDFAVNLEKPDGNTVYVSRYGSSGWTRAGSGDMRVEGNKLMLRLSKKLLGIEQGRKLIDVRFKWADNYQYNEDGSLDVWTFYRNGDSAPLGRLMYVYSERG